LAQIFWKEDEKTYFCVTKYPKKTHLLAVGSSFPLCCLWTCTNETNPNILGGR